MLPGIYIARASKNGMMLVLYGIISLIIKIKAIKLSSIKAWVDDSEVAQWAGSVFPPSALMPAGLYVEPMRSCAELCYDSPQMSVAAVLDVWLTSIPHFDIFIYLGFARGVQLKLRGMG